MAESLIPTIREINKLNGGPAGFTICFDLVGDSDEIIGWFMDSVPSVGDLEHWHFYAQKANEDYRNEFPNEPAGFFNAVVPDTSTMVIRDYSVSGFKPAQAKSLTERILANPLILLAITKDMEPAMVDDHSIAVTEKWADKFKLAKDDGDASDDKPSEKVEVKPRQRKRPRPQVKKQDSSDEKSAVKPKVARKPRKKAAPAAKAS